MLCRVLDALGVALVRYRARICLDHHMLGRELLQLVQDPPAPSIQPSFRGPLDPLAIGPADLVEQAGIIALSPQQLAQEP